MGVALAYHLAEEGETNVRRRLSRTRTVRRLVETGSATGAEAGFCEDCAYLDPEIAASYFPDALVQCAKDLEPTLNHFNPESIPVFF